MKTADKEKLWDAYRQKKTQETREQLIIEYAQLVKLVAGRLSMYLGHNVEYDDLVSYGIFGLIDAIDKFDLEKNVKFETYASLRIRGAILDQIRKMDWIPRSVRQRQRKIDEAMKQIEMRTGKTASDEELAKQLGLTDEELCSWQTQLKVTNVVSLNEFEENGSEPMIDSAHPVRFSQPEEVVEEAELKEKLQAYKESLSRGEIEKLVADTKHLQEYQEEPSSQEDLEKIPMLTRADISCEIAPIYNEEMKIADIPTVFHEIETNGIGYLDLMFDLSDVPEKDLPMVGLLQAVLGIIDTEHYEYGELFNEINRHTGGIGTSLELYPDVTKVKEKEFRATFEIKAKALYGQIPFAIRMMKEILTASKLDDEKRLKEILSMTKTRLQDRFLSAGHSAAALRAMSYKSPISKFKDTTNGIGYYQNIREMEEHFEEKKEEITNGLKALSELLFRKGNVMISYTASREGLAVLEEEIGSLKEVLYPERMPQSRCILHCEKKNEGFKTSSKVQFAAKAGNFIDAGEEYNGALQILKVIMSYEYLWINIRVKGGAYGCMSNFNRIGEGYFVSYRDPNLGRTLEIYDGVPEYLENFTVSERDMTKYIIGTISNIDQPMTPATKGDRSMNLYMNHVSAEMIRKEREQILTANQEDIRALAGVARAVLANDQICVIGNEAKIEEEKELFMTVENLF